MHYNYGTVASIEGGKVTLCWRGHRIVARQTGSLRQAMRFVERWVAARSGLPGARKPPRKTPDDCVRWLGSRVMTRRKGGPAVATNRATSREELWAMEAMHKQPSVLSNDISI
ncbi:hypothetical protein VDP44_10980 [Xanthomonas campestris pv. campestris]|nr:hypothetical protein [Xanthomonas campestris pv. campestris]MEB2056386.1 hypothetical protein [Xanthomonas campestris pv. campestris]